MADNVWALQDAKNGFSRVVESALKSGPQTVTRRGKETVVVVSIDEYRKTHERGGSIVEFFTKSPLQGVNLEVARDHDAGREVSL